MKPKDFFKKYTNKRVDFDGRYGDQCVDLFNQYLVEVLNIKNPIQMFPVASAFQIWDYAKGNVNFKRIENTPEAVPQEGDIIVWAKSSGLPHGHVAIYVSGDVMKFKSFDQNWPTGNNCQVIDHNYTNPKVTGWLRPVKLREETPEKPENSVITFIKDWYSKLDGNKTNYTVIAIIATVILYHNGYINEDTLNLLDTIFLAMVGFSLRDAIKKK